MASVLYISYDGVLEPLGESQVLAYLRGLAARHQIVLLSYEKKADLENRRERDRISRELMATGITWVPIRYHKRPSLPATAFDVAIGVTLGRFLVWRHRVDIIHVRSYVAALIGHTLQRVAGVHLVFDMRGLWADEKVDAGSWKKNGWLYRTAKRLERRFVQDADVVVSLTGAAVPAIRALVPGRSEDLHVEVIPTCVDLGRFEPATLGDPATDRAVPALRVGCVGSVGAWGGFDLVARSFTILRVMRPDAQLVVLNRGEHRLIRNDLERYGIRGSCVDLRAVPFDRIPAEMRRLTVGLLFYGPGFSHIARAPTKLGEFLASGIPCVATGGVGDVDRILEEEGVGVVLRGEDPTAQATAWRSVLALANDETVPRRCRRVAERYFSLAAGTEKYDRIYTELSQIGK